MEPVDNRQLPSRLWAPGSGQACRKILGFALISNCELKFGPVHNVAGTWLHKAVVDAPQAPALPPARRAHHPHEDGAEGGCCAAGSPPGSSRPTSRAQG